MKLLHTEEEIIYFNNLITLQRDLKKLGDKFNNSEVLDLASKYESIVKLELDKYNEYIGIKCQAPPAYLSKSKEYRDGKIEGNFYFNGKSVRCTFRYISGGFDTHSLKELE